MTNADLLLDPTVSGYLFAAGVVALWVLCLLTMPIRRKVRYWKVQRERDRSFHGETRPRHW